LHQNNVGIGKVSMNAKWLIFYLTIIPTSAIAWDGYDSDSGSQIEIQKRNLVRQGKDIDFYDYEEGEYGSGRVISITKNGRGARVEIEDDETGEERTFYME